MQNDSSKKKHGANWIGWLIFLLVILGPNLMPHLSRLVGQLTGGAVQLSGPMSLVALLVALVMIGTVISVIRSIGGSGKSDSPGLPSSPSSASSPRSLSEYQSPGPSRPTSVNQALSSIHQEATRYSGQQQRPGESEWDRFASLFDDSSLFDQQEEGLHFSGTSSSHVPNPLQANHSSKPFMKGLPQPPRFEPVVNGKVLAVSILGAILLGGFLLLVGGLPVLLP